VTDPTPLRISELLVGRRASGFVQVAQWRLLQRLGIDKQIGV
jgi:hypothetical protein